MKSISETALSYLGVKQGGTKQKYVDDMLARTNSMFTWDGLPDTIPSWLLEAYLQTYGNVIFK